MQSQQHMLSKHPRGTVFWAALTAIPFDWTDDKARANRRKHARRTAGKWQESQGRMSRQIGFQYERHASVHWEGWEREPERRERLEKGAAWQSRMWEENKENDNFFPCLPTRGGGKRSKVRKGNRRRGGRKGQFRCRNQLNLLKLMLYFYHLVTLWETWSLYQQCCDILEKIKLNWLKKFIYIIWPSIPLSYSAACLLEGWLSQILDHSSALNLYNLHQPHSCSLRPLGKSFYMAH